MISDKRYQLATIRRAVQKIQIRAYNELSSFKIEPFEAARGQVIYQALTTSAEVLNLYISDKMAVKHSSYRYQPASDKFLEDMSEQEFQVLFDTIKEQITAFLLFFSAQLKPIADTPDGKYITGLFKRLENLLEANNNLQHVEE